MSSGGKDNRPSRSERKNAKIRQILTEVEEIKRCTERLRSGTVVNTNTLERDIEMFALVEAIRQDVKAVERMSPGREQDAAIEALIVRSRPTRLGLEARPSTSQGGPGSSENTKSDVKK